MSDVSSTTPDPRPGPVVENPASAGAIQRLGLVFAIFTVLLFYVLITSWPVVEGPNATQFKPFRLFGLYCDWPADKRMLFTVVMAGAIGSLVHALTSFTDFVGNNRFSANWIWWYALRLPIGSALAIFFYFIVRGGLLVPNLGSGLDSTFSVKATLGMNPYSIAAFAALAGMFARSATDKLSEVFDAMMSRKNPVKRDDPLHGSATLDVKPAKLTKGKPEPLVVSGKGFSKETEVKINGVKRDFEFANNQIKIVISEADVKDKGTLELGIKNPGAEEIKKKIEIVEA